MLLFKKIIFIVIMSTILIGIQVVLILYFSKYESLHLIISILLVYLTYWLGWKKLFPTEDEKWLKDYHKNNPPSWKNK